MCSSCLNTSLLFYCKLTKLVASTSTTKAHYIGDPISLCTQSNWALFSSPIPGVDNDIVIIYPHECDGGKCNWCIWVGLSLIVF